MICFTDALSAAPAIKVSANDKFEPIATCLNRKESGLPIGSKII